MCVAGGRGGGSKCDMLIHHHIFLFPGQFESTNKPSTNHVVYERVT